MDRIISTLSCRNLVANCFPVAIPTETARGGVPTPALGILSLDAMTLFLLGELIQLGAVGQREFLEIPAEKLSCDHWVDF